MVSEARGQNVEIGVNQTASRDAVVDHVLRLFKARGNPKVSHIFDDLDIDELAGIARELEQDEEVGRIQPEPTRAVAERPTGNHAAVETGRFVMVSHDVLMDVNLSIGARLLYSIMLSYRFGKDFVFPGQERLAHLMNVTSRTIRTYLAELDKARTIRIERRGKTKTNLYHMLRLPQSERK
jgi:hypothetical protein